ncbi:MAG TPA: long-chain fatty aldehyde decarbonylase [Thermoanaerobaculia bacterium]|jgi:rubrerythrin|nr:long-chain fatty aldehyde decarbonylase [Thermoanaerobaculia bacterium]
MESLMEMTPETEYASPTAPIWQDVLAQALTGELVAAMNYAALAAICDDPEEAEEAREHAAIERSHAVAFAAVGRKIGVDVVSNVDGKHWKRVREAFMRCVAERDTIGCLIVQEIMLEAFALASYNRVAIVAPGILGKVFGAIAADEQEHADHAMAILKAERDANPERFDDKLHRLHLEVMTTLAAMLTKECKDGHCEVCESSCVKPSLFEVNLSAAMLRGASLQQYLKTLDALGLPGEVTLAWIAQLPV